MVISATGSGVTSKHSNAISGVIASAFGSVVCSPKGTLSSMWPSRVRSCQNGVYKPRREEFVSLDGKQVSQNQTVFQMPQNQSLGLDSLAIRSNRGVMLSSV